MRLSEIGYSGQPPVDGYGPGFFRTGGKLHHGMLLIGPEGVDTWGGVSDAAPLLALAGRVDVLFIGTGAEVAFPPADLRRALEEAGIGVEAMASPTAARSYNMALAEGRRVAVALTPV